MSPKMGDTGSRSSHLRRQQTADSSSSSSRGGSRPTTAPLAPRAWLPSSWLLQPPWPPPPRLLASWPLLSSWQPPPAAVPAQRSRHSAGTPQGRLAQRRQRFESHGWPRRCDILQNGRASTCRHRTRDQRGARLSPPGQQGAPGLPSWCPAWPWGWRGRPTCHPSAASQPASGPANREVERLGGWEAGRLGGWEDSRLVLKQPMRHGRAPSRPCHPVLPVDPAGRCPISGADHGQNQDQRRPEAAHRLTSFCAAAAAAPLVLSALRDRASCTFSDTPNLPIVAPADAE